MSDSTEEGVLYQDGLNVSQGDRDYLLTRAIEYLESFFTHEVAQPSSLERRGFALAIELLKDQVGNDNIWMGSF